MLPKFTTAKFTEDFLKAMLADAGMDKLPANVQEQMLSDLYARLEDWMFGYIVRELKEENLTKFREMNEAKAEQAEMEKFLEEKIPNAKEFFAKIMMDFRKSYLGLN